MSRKNRQRRRSPWELSHLGNVISLEPMRQELERLVGDRRARLARLPRRGIIRGWQPGIRSALAWLKTTSPAPGETLRRLADDLDDAGHEELQAALAHVIWQDWRSLRLACVDARGAVPFERLLGDSQEGGSL